MSDAIVSGLFSLGGVMITFVGTYFLNRNFKREERCRHYMKQNLEELKAFYNLEQLYMKAVADLRKQLPEPEGSTNELGIQREFRRRNEDNENVTITMTAKNADKALANLER